MNCTRGLRVLHSASLLSVTLWLVIGTLSAKSQTFTIIHSFAGGPDDGAYPSGRLIRDPLGNLYGASLGGSLGWGTVFSIAPDGQERVLYNFQDSADGLNPSISFLEADSIVGTAYQGGVNLFGTVFKLNLKGKLTVLFSCCNPTGIGAFPGGVIRDIDRNLYVVAFAGGDFGCDLTGCGTLFKLNNRNLVTFVHTFGEAAGDGSFPNSSLVRDAAGNLYGTTTFGGSYGYGTVFKIGAGGNETTLYSFLGGSDGTYPSGGVHRDSQGNLYGTTSVGGSYNYGTVFKVASSGAHLVLYNFNGSDGAQPAGGVALASNGNLYGVTYAGGRHDKGTVFQLSENVNFKVLHEFSGTSDGEYPESVLLMNGALYGVTYQGGAYNSGAVFKLVP